MNAFITLVLLFVTTNLSAASSYPWPSALTAAARRDEFDRPTCADRTQCTHCRGHLPLSPLRYPAIGCRGMLFGHPEPESEAPVFCIINETGLACDLKTPWQNYMLDSKKMQRRRRGWLTIYGSSDCIIHFPPHHIYCIPKNFFRTTLTLQRVKPDGSLVARADAHDPALARDFVIPSIQAVTSTLVVFNYTGCDLQLHQAELGDHRDIQASSFCIISPADLHNYRRVGMRLFLPRCGEHGAFFDVPTDWLRNNDVQAITISSLSRHSATLSAHTLRVCENSLIHKGIGGVRGRGKLLACADGPLVHLDPYEGIPVVEEFDVAPRELTSGLASLFGAESDE